MIHMNINIIITMLQHILYKNKYNFYIMKSNLLLFDMNNRIYNIFEVINYSLLFNISNNAIRYSSLLFSNLL
jgi:hypothetical protein